MPDSDTAVAKHGDERGARVLRLIALLRTTRLQFRCVDPTQPDLGG